MSTTKSPSTEQPETQKQSFNFIDMEKKWLTHWNTSGTIQQYLHKNDNSQDRFSFQDGPITANNPMGVHHAWGRTYKDLWQKFYNLLGHKQRFQNGFDCQGLWVEVEVEKELALKSKKDIENLVPGDRNASIAKFVQMCKDRVYKYSAIQTEQSKRLGYFMDWDHSYFTMSDENNYMIWHFLKKCYEHGWVYKGHDSVPWCPRCETAISQHEMLTEDYKELTHETVFVKLPITTKGWENTSLLVWTTTPWTIPANVAVGVNTKYTYGVWQDQNSQEKYVFLLHGGTSVPPTREDKKEGSVSLERYIAKYSDKTIKNISSIHGKDLVGLRYRAPFDFLEIAQKAKKENPNTFHTVIDASEVVTDTEGTGLLHVAPGAGQEDFKLGQKEKLPVIAPIADNADYVTEMGEFAGKNAKKHPEIIIDYLKNLENQKYLMGTMRFTHRYPACWRCKTELVWKVADEWYIAMDRTSHKASPGKPNNTPPGKFNVTLRERMVEVAKKIHWMPEFGLDRELDWLKNMHDWLISKKNRYWGLSLPIYECTKCDKFEIVGSKEELKERAVRGWDTFDGHSPHKPYIDEVVIACSFCSAESHRVDDVGNPWLDAGIVPYSTITEHNQGEPLYLKNRDEWQQWFPVDFITESFPGQFKNWFYALIAESTVLENEQPFKTVLGFATQVGEDGRPMHKSWGNSIEFNEGADKIGVDVMRWMFARHNPADNMLFGYKKADEVRRMFYLMLWNTYKFYNEYSELDGFTYSHSGNPLRRGIQNPDSGQARMTKATNILDLWILNRLDWLNIFMKKSFVDYNAKDAALEAERFLSDVSTWFIRRSRNRVAIHSEDEIDKRSFYHALYRILVDFSILVSPIMPFITEEMYTHLTGNESVHLTIWPEATFKQPDEQLFADMDFVRSIVEVGQRERKENKLKVRQPLRNMTVSLPKNQQFHHTNYQDGYEKLLKEELNVKNIIWSKAMTEEITVQYDTTLTPELIAEGELRDVMRQIQAERKTMGVKLTDKVYISVPAKFKQFENILKKSVSAASVEYKDEVRVIIKR